MKTKIHNQRTYTPAGIEAFRARMETEQNRADEYADLNEDLNGDGLPLVGVLMTWLLFIVIVGVIGTVIYFCWQSSNRLVGL